eukprot:355514-Chlamydomonas_euryale.AAC.3
MCFGPFPRDWAHRSIADTCVVLNGHMQTHAQCQCDDAGQVVAWRRCVSMQGGKAGQAACVNRQAGRPLKSTPTFTRHLHLLPALVTPQPSKQCARTLPSALRIHTLTHDTPPPVRPPLQTKSVIDAWIVAAVALVK